MRADERGGWVSACYWLSGCCESDFCFFSRFFSHVIVWGFYFLYFPLLGVVVGAVIAYLPPWPCCVVLCCPHSFESLPLQPPIPPVTISNCRVHVPKGVVRKHARYTATTADTKLVNTTLCPDQYHPRKNGLTWR